MKTEAETKEMLEVVKVIKKMNQPRKATRYIHYGDALLWVLGKSRKNSELRIIEEA